MFYVYPLHKGRGDALVVPISAVAHLSNDGDTAVCGVPLGELNTKKRHLTFLPGRKVCPNCKKRVQEPKTKSHIMREKAIRGVELQRLAKLDPGLAERKRREWGL